MRDLAYLKLLAREYPTVKAASSEIINLMAIRGLPKGTEYFFSDLHGEYEAFIHLLRKSHPAVPILTISKIPYPEDLLLQLEGNDNPPVRRLEQLHREIVGRIRKEGDENTHFQSGAELLGSDCAECSVDGCHITDLGFARMSNALSPVIAGLLH